METRTLEALRTQSKRHDPSEAQATRTSSADGCGTAVLDEAADVEGALLGSLFGFDEESSAADSKRVKGTGKILTAKCEDCGVVKRGFYWEPGTPCPRCGSQSGFLPSVADDCQGQHGSPDRTSGPATCDRVFAHLVKWAGMVGEKSLEKCLRKQERLAMAHFVVPGVEEILVRRALLTREQVEAISDVLNFQEIRAGLFWDQEQEFLAAAVRNGWLDSHSARRLAQQYSAAASRKHSCVPLGYFAMERGFLTDDQVCAIYREERAQGRGLLHEIRDALRSRGIPEARPQKSHSWIRPMAMAATAMMALIIS